MNPRHFKQAKKLSLKSEHPRYHLGALLVDHKGNVLGRGWNLMRTDPKSNSFSRRQHAEHVAIKDAFKRSKRPYKRISLYIHRSGKANELRCAKPCPRCLEMLKEYGIKEVYYTSEFGYERLVV